jgi:hypothetical protein
MPARDQVVLRDMRDGGDSRWLAASLTDDGDLLIEGCDRGAAVEGLFGSREYEWSWTIHSGHLARLRDALGCGNDVLKGLQASFSGDAAAGLKAFLDGHAIAHDVWSRTGD